MHEDANKVDLDMEANIDIDSDWMNLHNKLLGADHSQVGYEANESCVPLGENQKLFGASENRL